jgi:hypothetical protein
LRASVAPGIENTDSMYATVSASLAAEMVMPSPGPDFSSIE